MIHKSNEAGEGAKIDSKFIELHHFPWMVSTC